MIAQFTKNRLMALMIVLIALLAVAPLYAQEAEPVTVTDANGNEVVIEDASRIITIGGTVTETVFALGLQDQIIAIDDSSIYPAAIISELPSVGYLRFLTAEPILALEPTLIIATQDVGPQEVVEQLQASGITFLIVPAVDTPDGAVQIITTIAAALSSDEAGAAIVEGLQADIATAEALTATVETTPRVMFIFARGEGVTGIAGTNTGADEMIALAGGENAVTDYEGYEAISAEAVIAADPDIIVTTSNSIESLGGIETFTALPGIAETTAAQNGNILYSMDDLYLLGFGPRTGDAVLDLTYLLHPELPRPLPVVLRLQGDFPILLQALDIAGQVEFYSGEGPYTLFAPNGDAFATLPPGLLGGLFSSPISVQAVIAYHVVEGIYTAEDLAALDGQSLTSLLGQELAITIADDGTVLVNDVAVVAADLEASNGIIHVVGGVLLPTRQ